MMRDSRINSAGYETISGDTLPRLSLVASEPSGKKLEHRAALSSLRFNEIDMELVDLEPRTFEVKLDREFPY
jgi:hypothetical protein